MKRQFNVLLFLLLAAGSVQLFAGSTVPFSQLKDTDQRLNAILAMPQADRDAAFRSLTSGQQIQLRQAIDAAQRKSLREEKEAALAEGKNLENLRTKLAGEPGNEEAVKSLDEQILSNKKLLVGIDAMVGILNKQGDVRVAIPAQRKEIAKAMNELYKVERKIKQNDFWSRMQFEEGLKNLKKAEQLFDAVEQKADLVVLKVKEKFDKIETANKEKAKEEKAKKDAEIAALKAKEDAEKAALLAKEEQAKKDTEIAALIAKHDAAMAPITTGKSELNVLRDAYHKAPSGSGEKGKLYNEFQAMKNKLGLMAAPVKQAIEETIAIIKAEEAKEDARDVKNWDRQNKLMKQRHGLNRNIDALWIY
ncbi:MAG: hypothetical protein L7F78_11540 [Syntrophales bacterium LBB04]|nr:hypothetical protein [Syntrophales bacterium LBB04]